jgi:hypothetical protein
MRNKAKFVISEEDNKAVLNVEDDFSMRFAVFSTPQDARDYVCRLEMTDEDRESEADRIKRASYWQDVRDTAESIKSELLDRVKDGEYGDSLREWLLEHIHETIDGSARVIYTRQAQEALLYSDNDGAYIEEFGSDGVVEDGAIIWSRLAFGAFDADVKQQLESIGVDLTAPVPNCDDCDSDDQEQRRHQINGRWECQDCRDLPGSPACPVGRLVGSFASLLGLGCLLVWFVGWLLGCLHGCLVSWLVDWFVGWLLG